MLRAPLLTLISFSATLRSSLPHRITFAPSARCDTMPSALSAARSISVAFMRASSLVRTSGVSSRVGELKPRLGRRRCSGIWPPSKPTLWKPPERAFCPLCPRPAVLPQPEPPPRPTRCRSFFEPGAGFREFSLMGSVVDSHEVIDAVDHAAHRRGIGELDRLVDLLQPEPLHRVAVALLDAGKPLHEADLDLIHREYPRPSCRGAPRSPLACSSPARRSAWRAPRCRGWSSRSTWRGRW